MLLYICTHIHTCFYLNVLKLISWKAWVRFFSLFGKCPSGNITYFARILCFSVQSKQNNKRRIKACKNAWIESLPTLIFTLKHSRPHVCLCFLLFNINKNQIQFNNFEWTQDQTCSFTTKRIVKRTNTRCNHPSFTGSPTPLKWWNSL